MSHAFDVSPGLVKCDAVPKKHCSCRDANVFNLQSNAAEALLKVDTLFEEDAIPDFQQSREAAAAQVSQEQAGPTTALSLVYQKPLVWAAVHLLLYLEQQCQGYAKQVSCCRDVLLSVVRLLQYLGIAMSRLCSSSLYS